MAFLLFASVAVVAEAKSFLDARVGASSIERALLSELSGKGHAAQLQMIEKELGPMYTSLPKNAHGRLDPVPVRYAMHRYFMQKHGWFVNGLGASSSSNENSSSTSIMKERAPAFIQNLFEHRLHGQGLNQHDLAVFAATLSDLIHNEVSGNLQQVYAALELPTLGAVTEAEYDMASKAYLLAYMSGGREVVSRMEELASVERAWDEDYPAWNDTLLWASDLKQTVDVEARYRSNPFVPARWRSFEQHMGFLQEFGHRLGTFQNLECHKLKNQLAEIEDAGTGRVPLSRFYRGGLEGDWTFSESVSYLRHIGALDEADPKRISVVIPNYIQSQSNCLAGSSFYSVCCLDECEGLLGHVEQEVKAPSASPSQIAAVVEHLQSDTVFAPRNLSKALVGRLDEIAALHGGRVPLHGRLFAQWMHHAYPRECHFPHIVGTASRISPVEWMDAMDIDSAEATEEEMASFVRFEQEDRMSSEAKVEALPWSMAEELVGDHLEMAKPSPSSLSSRALRGLAAVLILASLAAPSAKFASSALLGRHGSSGKPLKFEV